MMIVLGAGRQLFRLLLVPFKLFQAVLKMYRRRQSNYPQTPKHKSWKLAFDGYSRKERIKLLHSLGNLVLLAHSKNASCP